MFDRLASLARRGLLTTAMIDNAVAKHWVTEDQAAELTGLL